MYLLYHHKYKWDIDLYCNLVVFYFISSTRMVCLKVFCGFQPMEEVGFLLAHLESAYSLIWGSHKIWGKGGGDTLDLL